MQNILFTLKYFDIFDYPLKKEEIWKWMFKRIMNQELGIMDYDKNLLELVKLGKVEHQDGYYFLKGRSDLVKLRQEREKVSIWKIRKAQRISRLLGFIPGVKMIAVCSDLGYLNADEDSDIDLFIVTAKNRIWTVRFWCVVLMKLLGQRPTQGVTKDKICLSYFVTEDNLNLEQTKINEPACPPVTEPQGDAGRDIHLIYLLSQYLPIYSEDKMWDKFTQANNWIKKYLPNFNYHESLKHLGSTHSMEPAVRPHLVWLKKLISNTVFGWEEELYKRIQLKMMAPQLKQGMQQNDKKVIINNRMLKLHINDKRAEINKKLT